MIKQIPILTGILSLSYSIYQIAWYNTTYVKAHMKGTYWKQLPEIVIYSIK